MGRPINEITEEIIGAAIQVHRELGPGLLESAYEACLVHELSERGLVVEQQKPIPLRYHGLELDCAYRLDILVEGAVIVEVKAVEKVLPLHEAQLLSYLRLTKCSIGLLLNFNVTFLRQGLHRLANNYRGG
jgi:GxxExxY protein